MTLTLWEQKEWWSLDQKLRFYTHVTILENCTNPAPDKHPRPESTKFHAEVLQIYMNLFMTSDVKYSDMAFNPSLT